MTDRSHDIAVDLLRKLTGDPASQFRGDQWNVIDAIANRRQRVLLVQRTGWGKSAVYFISAKLLRMQGYGPTLIVSPLLGLMRNQVHAGRRMGLCVDTLNSTNSDRFPDFIQMVRDDTIDALLVSPERFANEDFQQKLFPLFAHRMGLMVIDEAHCISDWGHDFRPDYQRLANVIAQLPASMPILATTATANDRVVTDVAGQLGSLHISRGHLHRENLALQALPTMSATERYAWLAQVIPTLPGRGIVYTSVTRDAEQVATWLQQHGIDAHAYHASIESPDYPSSEALRLDLEERFTGGDLRVLVATSALGMGYDNPDVRFVIHYQTPSSIIAYYQQVGRAGRGKEGAVGVLMSGPEDNQIQDFFRTSSLPSPEDVEAVHAAFKGTGDLGISAIESRVNMSRGRLENVLKYLAVQTPPTVTKLGSKWRRTGGTLDDGYARRRDALIRQRIGEWEELNVYRTARSGCRMHALLTALDDPAPVERCGICDLCLGRPVVAVQLDRAMIEAAARFLNRPVLHSIEPRMVIPTGAFPSYGFSGRIGAGKGAEPGIFMAHWGERPDIHEGILEGRAAGRINDEVLAGAIALITDLWQPGPKPEWITCLPSMRYPTLLPDFCRRLGDQLGIPFAICIRKVRDTRPQREQENSFFRASNLDGAFAIDDPIPNGPLLLVDDAVDSRWTMTVVAMLLRRHGSGPVFPFALTSTQKRDDD